MSQAILPSIVHTGGLAIRVFNMSDKFICKGHIALEAQPLETFVKAILKENGFDEKLYFEIKEFSSETSEMKVSVLMLPNVH